MIARVALWGRTIGAVSLEPGSPYSSFQYDAAFARSGIGVSPLMMPLSDTVYRFPSLAPASFHGLPGLLADCLPDRFGNALIDAWLATQGRSAAEFSALDRLCYTGNRGMGALEFSPALGPRPSRGDAIEIDALVRLASEVLEQRGALQADFSGRGREKALKDILRVGTSAGGARAKAVVAWNPETNEIRSGQVPAARGFSHWLLKFDGVTGNRDRELEDPRGFGALEFAYHRMALAAGVTMSECRLLEENGRRHFMTRRFDRDAKGGKLHMQSLCALAHLDFNEAGAHGYEQALLAILRLNLPRSDAEQQFRRMAFNIVARNQDDHTKNIAFLMDKTGRWSLSPAFDVTYSFNPAGTWTATHQMTVNGRRDGFTRADLEACARVGQIPRARAAAILEEVLAAVRRWPEFAAEVRLPGSWTEEIRKNHRLELH
jgi:serine/threonine-protein kinase HipA